MVDTAEKARALRLERLNTMIATRLEQPPQALETLISELRAGEAHTKLWEGLHAAAARDGKERELAAGYGQTTTPRRLQPLQPWAQAEILMHAADFAQGVLGDIAGSEKYLEQVLEVVPGHPEAYGRLERRYEGAGDKRRLVELYGLVAAAPPKTADDLARKAVNTLVPLPAKTPISDLACKQLVLLVPTNPSMLDALEGHCRKTQRFGLACELFEAAIAQGGLPDATNSDQRRRLIELYIGDAAMPANAIAHVEALLDRDPADAAARSAAERLLGTREVAPRAAAALQKARRQARSG
jgi:tetratricopeptide (TPR) repeat protein